MSDIRDPIRAITTQRAFSTADLAFINRMTTTGVVLPSVAHEINNSLQVISGMVEILTMRGQLPPDVADKVAKIAAQASKAATNLRDLVAFSRRDGVAPKVDLRSAAERAVALRRYYLARGKVDVVIDAPAEPLLANADSHYAVQVLVNLIVNAEEALANQDRREIRIALSRHDGFVHCELSDSGPGFAPEAASSACTPFFTTKPTGAGLGLAVARQLVEAEGGSLSIVRGTPCRVSVSWPEAGSP